MQRLPLVLLCGLWTNERGEDLRFQEDLDWIDEVHAMIYIFTYALQIPKTRESNHMKEEIIRECLSNIAIIKYCLIIFITL